MNPIEILLVEDNEGDVLLTREAFDEAKISNRLRLARDGKEAQDLLEHKAPFEHEPLPDLILLDLNLPRKNGFEVMDFLQSREDLKDIPIVVLTTSSSEKDIRESYSRNAAGFITKPLRPDIFLKVITGIRQFKLSILLNNPPTIV